MLKEHCFYRQYVIVPYGTIFEGADTKGLNIGVGLGFSWGGESCSTPVPTEPVRFFWQNVHDSGNDS